MSEKNTNKLNIFQRINAVMGDVDYILKGANAGKGLPYKFVSHDQVTGKLRGPMQKHGIVMISDMVDLVQDGNRTAIKMSISFVNIDDPKDRITSTWWGYGIDNQDKSIGKAVSYAVKYCLLKTFCLETGDDVEKDNIDHNKIRITSESLQTLKMMINGHDDIMHSVLQQCNGDLANITQSQYKAAEKWIQNMIEKKGG